MEKNKFRKYRSLVFGVLIILAGLYDIYVVQDYIRDQKYLPKQVDSNSTEIKIDYIELFKKEEVETIVTNSGDYRLTEKQLFNAIFNLCVGFAMILFGILKIENWFILDELEKLKNEKV